MDSKNRALWSNWEGNKSALFVREYVYILVNLREIKYVDILVAFREKEKNAFNCMVFAQQICLD